MTNWKQRYHAAHEAYQASAYPVTYNDWGYITKEIPDVRKANGLTRFVLDFLMWEGWRATRINTQGQYVEQKYMGRTIMKGWRKSTTRRGTADISATIKGRSCMLEIKIHPDKPSTEQLQEQERERAAGGTYEFIYTPEQFFEFYDNLISLT